MGAATEISGYTGWTRQHWLDLSDRLVTGVWAHAKPGTSRLRLPGPVSQWGRRSDSLEAFARSMQLAAFRLAGSDTDVLGAGQWYSRGLAEGTDPSSPHRWPHPGQLDQAKVEAASIAMSFLLDRRRLWDPLEARVKAQVITWMEQVVGQRFPPLNWVWFQIVVEAFLREVGGRYCVQDIARCLSVHESLIEPDGWYRDGMRRGYDYYVGWGLHTYPILIASLVPDLPGVAELAGRWHERLYRYLSDQVTLIGGDGAPLIQGRSLIYRFATAAPFWAGALAGATPLSPGLTRRVASGIVAHFAEAGVPNAAGLLSVGWHEEFVPMRQSYSGAGSPYWAGIGMLGLMLAASHPVWTAAEEPLPIERGDVERAIRAPGWLVSATRADGIVRIVNHGTDSANPGELLSDSPWYARFGYSTATAPDLTKRARATLDNEVVLLDSAGLSSSRTGFALVSISGRVAVSRSRAHWVKPGRPLVDRLLRRPQSDHGTGQPGALRLGPWLTVGSALHGAVEVRACRIDPVTADPDVACDAATVDFARLRISGAAVGTDGRCVSEVFGLVGLECSGSQLNGGHNQLAQLTTTPWVSTAAVALEGTVYVAAVVLRGADGPAAALPSVSLGADSVTVFWPDGLVDVIALPIPG